MDAEFHGYCDFCQEEEDVLYECSNCMSVMCFECIGLDDICPECHGQGKIFEM